MKDTITLAREAGMGDCGKGLWAAWEEELERFRSLIIEDLASGAMDPYCYVYEYDSAFGLHQEFHPREWNGMKPSRAVITFTAQQVAAAVAHYSEYATLYEELRKATDGGSESMTHKDAVESVEYMHKHISELEAINANLSEQNTLLDESLAELESQLATARQPHEECEVDWKRLYELEVKKKQAIYDKYERDIAKLPRIVPMDNAAAHGIGEQP